MSTRPTQAIDAHAGAVKDRTPDTHNVTENAVNAKTKLSLEGNTPKPHDIAAPLPNSITGTESTFSMQARPQQAPEANPQAKQMIGSFALTEGSKVVAGHGAREDMSHAVVAAAEGKGNVRANYDAIQTKKQHSAA